MKKLIEFAKILGKLKKAKRAGWTKYNIPNSESVAEHLYRTAVLAMVLAPKVGVNQAKVIKMALIHDIGEAEIGDIITHASGKPLPNLNKKLAKERKAVLNIFSLIDGKEYTDLFEEFEAKKTKEAKFVNQLGRLEAVIQAVEYSENHKFNTKEFFTHAESILENKLLKKLLIELQ